MLTFYPCTRCRILKIDDLTIYIDAIDARDGSPLLDIKAYFPPDMLTMQHRVLSRQVGFAIPKKWRFYSTPLIELGEMAGLTVCCVPYGPPPCI